jgi:hypothetical protein
MYESTAYNKMDDEFNSWVDFNNSNNPPQHQSPIFEHGAFGYLQQNKPTEQSYNPQRMLQPLPPYTAHQQLQPLIMPSNVIWPSMLTNPASYSAPPVAIPASAPPLIKGNGTKLPAIHATPSIRKTLTDSDRQKICQYHKDNPSVKQTEIGGESLDYYSTYN